MRRQLFKQISQSRQVCCTWITGSAFPFGYRLMADTWSIRNKFLRHMTFQAFSADDFPPPVFFPSISSHSALVHFSDISVIPESASRSDTELFLQFQDTQRS